MNFMQKFALTLALVLAFPLIALAGSEDLFIIKLQNWPIKGETIVCRALNKDMETVEIDLATSPLVEASAEEVRAFTGKEAEAGEFYFKAQKQGEITLVFLRAYLDDGTVLDNAVAKVTLSVDEKLETTITESQEKSPDQVVEKYLCIELFSYSDSLVVWNIKYDPEGIVKQVEESEIQYEYMNPDFLYTGGGPYVLVLAGVSPGKATLDLSYDMPGGKKGIAKATCKVLVRENLEVELLEMTKSWEDD